ncbi:MAG TPA: YdcF family protein [Edaphobacter sp.]|jgi:uncharacterized SAM-binding protein YcdF (DUF218 family)|nr:YdcF family protein [Edaphobacter sp.]
MQSLRKLLAIFLAIFLVAVAAIAIVYRAIPNHNTDLAHFDTIIVLGTPARADGTPSPEQRERTLEGVREFKAGVAPNIILTGGPAHNRFVEAHVMAALAITQGVPPSAVIEEGQAQNTVQNIFYSQRIMSDHHWTSAEVVSSPSHLPRTALILRHFSFAWRTHAAPWPTEYSFVERAAHFCVEAQYCFKLQIMGFPVTRFLPHPA